MRIEILFSSANRAALKSSNMTAFLRDMREQRIF